MQVQQAKVAVYVLSKRVSQLPGEHLLLSHSLKLSELCCNLEAPTMEESEKALH